MIFLVPFYFGLFFLFRKMRQDFVSKQSVDFFYGLQPEAMKTEDPTEPPVDPNMINVWTYIGPEYQTAFTGRTGQPQIFTFKPNITRIIKSNRYLSRWPTDGSFFLSSSSNWISESVLLGSVTLYDGSLIFPDNF